MIMIPHTTMNTMKYYGDKGFYINNFIWKTFRVLFDKFNYIYIWDDITINDISKECNSIWMGGLG